MAKPDMSQEIADITAATEVIESATVFVNGVAARIDAAVEAAKANGATEEELQPVTDVATALRAKADELAAAVAANTPAG